MADIDLNDPKTRAEYRKHYAKRYAETAGEKEYVRKDKAHWYAFDVLYRKANEA